MVATRAIEPGEIILREKAAVVGPSLDGAKPQCLGCSIGLNELKTFTSAMLCTCGGMILPENPLDLTQSAVWRCKECPSTLPALQVSSQERNIMMERESIQRDDVPGLEDFLARQKKTLAPSHANMLDVKKQLR